MVGCHWLDGVIDSELLLASVSVGRGVGGWWVVGVTWERNLSNDGTIVFFCAGPRDWC